MKVLFLSQARTIRDQPDFDASFCAAVGEDSFRNIPYIGYAEKHGWKEFYKEVLRQNEDWHPDLVFFQFFHGQVGEGVGECCHALQQSKNHPLIFGSQGDLFYTGLMKCFARQISKITLELSQYADAFFSTSMGNVARELARNGAKNIIFLPHAFCPEHWPDWQEAYSGEPKFAITMLGSKGKWLSRYPWASACNTWKRRYVAGLLSSCFGSRFFAFGNGWTGPNGMGAVPFDAQYHIYQQSRVVIDAPAPVLNTTYYASDRPFFILASGTPMVYFYTPRFEKLLKPEEHVYYVYNLRDVSRVCKQILQLPQDVLDERRKKIQLFVEAKHMIRNRVDTIISTAQAIRNCREGNLTPLRSLREIRMWHFLEEVDLNSEYSQAVVNWRG